MDFERRARRQDGGPLDDVLQLSNVAGPVVSQQGVHHLGGDIAYHLAVPGSRLLDEIPDQCRNVPAAFAEGRQFDGHHTESVEEVSAEASLFDGALQNFPGSCKDPHVDRPCLRGAQPFELPLLKYPQKFRLDLEWQIADLIEEDRSTISELEPAYPLTHRAGEGSFFVAEQLALSQRAGKCGAVDYDQRAVAPRASSVDRSGDKLFTGTGLPLDQYPGVGGSDLLDDCQDPLDGSADADDTLEVAGAPDLTAQIYIFRLQTVLELLDVGQSRTKLSFHIAAAQGIGENLGQQAQALADAGLSRVTVSLDSLDDNVFRAMNDVRFSAARVLEGIDAAVAAGLQPVKINAVVRRGMNDQTVVELARHFKGSGHVLRFIEYMDVGTTNGWRLGQVVSGKEILDLINAEMPLEPVESAYRGEVAKRWRYVDGTGELGVITSVTRPFCGDCTRARLSAEGKLYTCLFAAFGTDLKDVLRSDAGDEKIVALVKKIWGMRRDRYSEVRTEETAGLDHIEMSYIGG